MKGTRGYIPPGYVPAPQFDPEDESSLEFIPKQPTEEVNSSQRPPSQQIYQQERWTSGICACFDDVPSCCLGCCCPCVLFGKNVEMLDGQSWFGPCVIHFLLWGVITGICCSLTEGTGFGLLASCVSCYACGYRKRLRTKYNLEEAPCGDFCTHFCCHVCAICQEYRELRERSTELGLVAPPSIQTMDMDSAEFVPADNS
ncbi:hypothetical protein O6H91_23G043300 [Diphasiastrum complanatum]|uniref:Uncharacterized protein n=2 Tax=Diphasiastrum complanatum TaxID=34168 RepID=A0ACC2AAA4_DIPCM|nr:hypothetical protein O6H91_23G042400 [Diphasiastrum complanatum]KAJ7514429.1 hypothetical protein O6H91_23G043300 [Diphasiastrum complanatum]